MDITDKISMLLADGKMSPEDAKKRFKEKQGKRKKDSKSAPILPISCKGLRALRAMMPAKPSLLRD